MLKLAVICGGPSKERGVSLNSARCVMDHLPANVASEAIYVSQQLEFYLISKSQLYCNTPSDFDFKLEQTATKITTDKLASFLSGFDLIFPLIHGKFGEDGKLQQMLSDMNVKYIGTGAEGLQRLFHKYNASKTMESNGFDVTSSILVTKTDYSEDKIILFLQKHSRVVVKPARGGSSLGVAVCNDLVEIRKNLETIFTSMDDEAMIEEYCVGREFTILVLATENNPVALVPTEIETSYKNNQIFDYRKKYLPTNNTLYHTPPKNLDMKQIDFIRKGAEKIFSLFDMQDFARIDGWVLADGRIVFTDINPISGTEQNSFLFRQSSLVGLTHAKAIEHILQVACRRYGIHFAPLAETKLESKEVFVLFGGNTPERQVSLMSGTNVWLKLLKSSKYKPLPFMLDQNNDIWLLPYNFCLNHTVEEIYENCIHNDEISRKLAAIKSEIDAEYKFGNNNDNNSLRKFSLNEFMLEGKRRNAFIFIGLHGGFGENGQLQNILEENKLLFNGSHHLASSICMDKMLTGEYIGRMDINNLYSLPRIVLSLAEFLKDQDGIWAKIHLLFADKKLIIKPRSEGCSSGIVVLENERDFKKYFALIASGSSMIPAKEFSNQPEEVELPKDNSKDFLIEEYIEVNSLRINAGGHIEHVKKYGWIELTVGVLECAGLYHSLNPSITIAESAVLSIEEKFQGGTGVNITPPPPSIFSSKQIQLIKANIEKFAKMIDIKNYARVDIFFNIESNQTVVIEANSLPALTPSTVIYHQMLAEEKPLYPLAFLELIISSAINSN